MKLVLFKRTEVELDLVATPLQDWPQEAREVANVLLSQPGAVERMQRDLFPKAWLAAKVEGRLFAAAELAEGGVL